MARKKGSTNYRQMTWAQLVELDFHPIEEMVRLAKAQDDGMDKFKMVETIASYVLAKPKAIEHSFAEHQNVKIIIGGTDD